MPRNSVVSREEWTAARIALLAREKALTRLRDETSRERRDLPWVRIDKPYVFEGPDGKESLADLFDGKSQLLVYHFMFDPSWSEGCKSCSFWADNGSVYHTYSCYARGLDAPNGAYQWLDLTPKGRDEDGLCSTMAWVRHHDKYNSR